MDQCWGGGGGTSTIDSILALHPAALGLNLSIPKNFSLDVGEIYWRHCLEKWTEAWSCQSNHLVLASGKIVLQKKMDQCWNTKVNKRGTAFVAPNLRCLFHYFANTKIGAFVFKGIDRLWILPSYSLCLKGLLFTVKVSLENQVPETWNRAYKGGNAQEPLK